MAFADCYFTRGCQAGDPCLGAVMDDDCSATRKGSRVVRMALGTSVIRAAVTNAYGTSTLRVPHG